MPKFSNSPPAIGKGPDVSRTSNDGLSAVAYAGDGAVLLAFDLPEEKTDHFAGFSIQCRAPDKGPYPTNLYWLKNRLSFDSAPKQTSPAGASTDSNIAPFQSYHWVHFPNAGPGNYTYTVNAAYFANGGPVQLKSKVALNVDLSSQTFPGFEVGFTRGYISSQAYVDKFKNAGIRPTPNTIDFDTKNFQPQYEWLGAHARTILFNFLDECKSDKSISVDAFTYDFDEPDVIDSLAEIGPRLRVYQDDSVSKDKSGNETGHGAPGSLEMQAMEKLTANGAQVKTGHFKRFSHDKVLIQKKNDAAVKVLTGSANFSVRGLYVQSNSVIVFDNPQIADLYEQAFDQAFTAPTDFSNSMIGSRWFDTTIAGFPKISFSFAPHTSPPFSIQTISDAIDAAKSSVLFAIMTTGGGSAITGLENLGSRKDLFSLGTIQQANQIKLFKPGIDANSSVTSFAFLDKIVPEPFKQEWRGGPGQVIHHKFVTCDFNGDNPVVFCGSSNLSEGGETSNGDNLIAIHDRKIATYYAIEALKLYDHYRFRSLEENQPTATPLTLDTTDGWIKPYYDPTDIKFRERTLLCPTAPQAEIPA